jgi:hypothetical protein
LLYSRISGLIALFAPPSLGWWKFLGSNGDVVGPRPLWSFCAGKIVMAELGFTAENMALRAKGLLGQ